MSADPVGSTTEDPGPLVRRLRGSTHLGVPRSALAAPGLVVHETSRLYGHRGVYRPAVALRTIQRLGPARHAIAQRTVAGIVEIHAPFAPAPPGKDGDKGATARPRAHPRADERAR